VNRGKITLAENLGLLDPGQKSPGPIRHMIKPRPLDLEDRGAATVKIYVDGGIKNELQIGSLSNKHKNAYHSQ
jgi:hypothetical protein